MQNFLLRGDGSSEAESSGNVGKRLQLIRLIYSIQYYILLHITYRYSEKSQKNLLSGTENLNFTMVISTDGDHVTKIGEPTSYFFRPFINIINQNEHT